MSNYIFGQDGELYHYGVKGMKWGVRRERAKRARVAASIRIANSKQLKNLEKMKLKRDKKARYEGDTTKLDAKIKAANKFINNNRRLMNKAMSGLTQKEIDRGRRQITALNTAGFLSGVIGTLTVSSIQLRERNDVAKKYGA